jgi:hypothetical protein
MLQEVLIQCNNASYVICTLSPSAERKIAESLCLITSLYSQNRAMVFLFQFVMFPDNTRHWELALCVLGDRKIKYLIYHFNGGLARLLKNLPKLSPENDNVAVIDLARLQCDFIMNFDTFEMPILIFRRS